MNPSRKEIVEVCKMAKEAGDLILLTEYKRMLRLIDENNNGQGRPKEKIMVKKENVVAVVKAAKAAFPIGKELYFRSLPEEERAMLHAVRIECTARIRGNPKDMKAWAIMEVAEKAAMKGHVKVLKGTLARLGIVL